MRGVFADCPHEGAHEFDSLEAVPYVSICEKLVSFCIEDKGWCFDDVNCEARLLKRIGERPLCEKEKPSFPFFGVKSLDEFQQTVFGAAELRRVGEK